MFSTTDSIYKRVIEDGNIVIYPSFSKAVHYLNIVKNLYLDGVEFIVGKKIADDLREVGLNNLHNHFPVEFVVFLNKYIDDRIREIALNYSIDFCDEIFDFQHEYYLYNHMETRVFYPINVACTSKLKFSHYQKLNLNNMQNPQEEIDHILSGKGENVIDKAYYSDIRKYYGDDLPYACRRTAPHRDTWYGHPQKCFNLWFAISGCTSENSVFFYPDTFMKEVKYIVGRNAPKKGFVYKEPYCPNIPDGQTIIFNPENLHASHIGTADQTRICVITRVNPEYPTYSKEFLNSQYEAEPAVWHSSINLRNRIYDQTFETKRENFIKEDPEYKKKETCLNIKTVKFEKAIHADKDYIICGKSDINDENRVLVEFYDKEVLIFKIDDKIRAMSNLCPHASAELMNGAIKGNYLICPHHLLQINLDDGKTSCSAMKQEMFDVKIENNKIKLVVNK